MTVLVSKKRENVRDEYFREPVTGSTLLSHQEKSQFPCLFCKKPHKSLNCCIASDIQTRNDIMRTSKCCFVCLKGSYLAKDCSSKIKCFKCSKQHRVTFCDSEESSHSSNSSSVTNITGVDDNTNILLQTAKIQLEFYLTAVLSWFYITPQLCNCLKLKTVGTRKMSIQTFKNNFRKYFRKSNLCILALDGSEIYGTYFVKEICALLNNQNINLAKENFPHIRNILLVDSNPNNEVYELIYL